MAMLRKAAQKMVGKPGAKNDAMKQALQAKAKPNAAVKALGNAFDATNSRVKFESKAASLLGRWKSK
jgi:hypothetical protein